MIANRLMIASAAAAIVVFVGTSGASAVDSHKRGGGHIGRSGAATGRSVAGQGYAGRHRVYGRYGHGRYGYRASGTGIGPGLGGWGYPDYSSTWASGNCPCRGHFTSGTAGAW